MENHSVLSKVIFIARILYSENFDLEKYDYNGEVPAFPDSTVEIESGWLLSKYKDELDKLTLSQLSKYPHTTDYSCVKKLSPGAKRALQLRILFAQKRAIQIDAMNIQSDDLNQTLLAVSLLLRY